MKKRKGQAETSKRGWRMLRRDGAFNIERSRRSVVRGHDLYHSLLSLSWTRFMCLLVSIYLGLNLVFAAAYLLCGNGALEGASEQNWPRHVLDAFFFSVQTFATIGYGRITPTGIGANSVVVLESIAGLLSVALSTGIIFARFSRPTARVMFSEKAIIQDHDGVPSLLLRMANARLNQIVEAQVNLTMMIREETLEGESYRNFYDLRLERSRSPFFVLSWTVVHPIVKDSPLRGMTREQLERAEVEILVSVSGIDDTLSQTIHARYSYVAEDLVWDGSFVDIIGRDEAGKVSLDLSKLSQVRLKA